MTTSIKSIIENKLSSRTIEQLKNDVKVAMTSEEEGSNMIFVIAMNILESKLSESEYANFEESL